MDSFAATAYQPMRDKGTHKITHIGISNLQPQRGEQLTKKDPEENPQGLLKNGGYLLYHKRSTIGATGLNFSVRNGKRWNPSAITTLNNIDIMRKK